MLQQRSFASVLESLERSLFVDLVASRPLNTCEVKDVAGVVFDRPENTEIDQVPVIAGDRIVGVLERWKCDNLALSVFEMYVPLEERMLIAASAGILTYIRLAARWQYHLVVKDNSIDGIVTRSDLLRLPVRAVLFTFLSHLEATMSETIRRLHSDGSWIRHLKSRATVVENEYNQAKRKNVYSDLLDFTQWCDKRDVLMATLPKEIKGSNTKFKRDLTDLEELRNNIMHANKYLADAEELARLAARAEHWILQLDMFRGDR